MTNRLGKSAPMQQIVIFIDGEPCPAAPGNTIAGELYALGRRAWRRSRAGDARGLLCGMGICFDCLVTVDHVPGQRACQVLVKDGMQIETGLPQGGQS